MTRNTFAFAVLDCCAALLVAHMVWYAFVGDSPLITGEMNALRAMMLALLHTLLPFMSIVRRNMQ